MKPKIVKLTRNGKKRFSVESEYDGKTPGVNYHGDGSYLKQTMAETIQEMFEIILRIFSLEKELIVVVRERELPQEERIRQEVL